MFGGRGTSSLQLLELSSISRLVAYLLIGIFNDPFKFSVTRVSTIVEILFDPNYLSIKTPINCILFHFFCSIWPFSHPPPSFSQKSNYFKKCSGHTTFYDDRITVSPDGLNDEQDDETNLPHFGQLDISIGLIAV